MKKRSIPSISFHISRTRNAAKSELVETFEEGGISASRHRETRDSVFSSCDYEGGKVPLQIRNEGKVFSNLSRGVVRGRRRKMGGGTGVSSGFELLPRSVSMEGVESTRERKRKKKKN